MLQNKIFSVDFTHKDALAEIVPRSPVISSYDAHWQGIYLEYHLQPGHETPEHSFQQHAIAINVSPEAHKVERVLDGQLKIEQMFPGDIAVIPASSYHLARWESEGEFILLSLDPNFFNQVIIESVGLQQVELIPQFATSDPLMQQIGLTLKSELKSEGVGSRVYVESLTNTICIHLLRHYSTYSTIPHQASQGKGLSQWKLRQVVAYIQNNLNQDLSLAEISATAGMSMYHFSRLFKQSTGLAPHQYVMNCRIQEAKKLLTTTENSIEQISQLVGFQNQSHFTNVFRKLLGTTPKVYREQTKI
ncbi:MAG TPA: AraC family transcriptional regulator [Nostocaceae cyanobacterium]|nr:AraC family transcriptional regulator [Nostocaceae cyanobacterium]